MCSSSCSLYINEFWCYSQLSHLVCFRRFDRVAVYVLKLFSNVVRSMTTFTLSDPVNLIAQTADDVVKSLDRHFSQLVTTLIVVFL